MGHKHQWEPISKFGGRCSCGDERFEFRAEFVADRWYRRFEPDMPVAMHRTRLAYAYVRAEAGLRPARRALYRAFVPMLRWLSKRLP